MSVNLGSAHGSIEIDASGVTKGLGEAVRAFQNFESSTSNVGAGLTRSLSQATQVVSGFAAGAGAGLTGALTYAVTAAASFESTMSGVAAVTGSTGQEFDKLRALALELGATTSFSASEAALAMEELAKAGISVSDIMGGGLAGTLSLAAAGGVELAQAAEIAANAMNQFGLSGDQVSHVADLFAGAANASSISVEDLAQSFNQVGLVASSFGLSIEEVTATLAAFGAQGLKGSDAGTALKTMLISLAAPTKESAALMKDLGLQFFDAQGKLKPLGGIAEELKTKLAGLTDQQRAAALAQIFGTDAIRAATILYGEGAAGIASYLAQVNQQGSAAAAAATRLDNLKGSLEGLKGSVETAAISLGSALTPALRAVAGFLTDLVNRFNTLPQSGQQMVAFLAAGAAAFLTIGGAIGLALPSIVAFVGALGTLLAVFGGPLLASVALVAAAFVAFGGSWRENLAGLAEGAQAIAAQVIAAFKQIPAVFSTLVTAFQTGDFSAAFGPLLAALDQVSAGLGAKLAGGVNNALSLFQTLRDAFVTFTQALAGNWGGQFDGQIGLVVKSAGLLGLALREAGSFVTGTIVPALRQIGPAALAGLGQIVAFLQGPVQSAIQGVLPTLGAAFSQIGTVVATVILPALAQVGTAISTGFSAALPVVQSLITSLATGFGAALPQIQAFLTTVQSGFTAIAPYAAQFAAAIQGGIAAALPALQQFGSLLSTAVGGALQVVAPLAQAFGQAIVSQWPAIVALGGQLGAIFGQLGGAMGALAPIAQHLAQDIGGLIVTQIGLLLGALGGLIGMLSGALPGAVQAASGVLTTIQGGIQVFTSLVEGMVGTVSALLAGDFAGAWEAAKGAIVGAAEGIQTVTSGLATVVIGVFQSLVGGVTGLVSGFASTVIGYIDTLYQTVTGSTTTFSSQVVAGWQILTSTVAATVSSWVAQIGSFFSNLGSTVSSAVTSLGSTVTSGFTSFTSAAAATVSGWVSNVVGFFTSLASQAGSAVSGLQTAVVGAFQSMVSGVTTAMSSVTSAVIGTLTSLAGQAASAAAGIGQAIIDGIGGALRAGAGALANIAQSVVQGVLDAAKSTLGIKSPSRAFAELGRYSMEGFAEGISANANAGRLAVADALGQALRAGQQGAALGAMVPLQFTGTPNLDILKVSAQSGTVVQRIVHEHQPQTVRLEFLGDNGEWIVKSLTVDAAARTQTTEIIAGEIANYLMVEANK